MATTMEEQYRGAYVTPWWYEPLADFIAGTVGGVSGKLIEYPFDTVKVKLQLHQGQDTRLQQGPIAMLRNVWEKEGLKGLYRGLPAPLVGTTIETAMLFTAMGAIKKYLFGEKDHLKLSDTCIAGGATGFFIAFILTPIELVKCRMQAQVAQPVQLYRNSFDCLRSSVRNEGLRVLYKGHVPTLVREIPGTAAWFGTYEGVLHLLGRHDRDSKNPLRIIAAGGMGGLAYNFILYPADTVKSTYQTQTTDRSLMTVARDIYRTGGVQGFYRGLQPTLLRAFPANAAIFLAYESVSRAMRTLSPFKLST